MSAFIRDIAVGNHQILQGVVVEVDKQTTPRPTPHRHSGIEADVAKRPVTSVAKQRVAACCSLNHAALLRIGRGIEVSLVSDAVTGGGKTYC